MGNTVGLAKAIGLARSCQEVLVHNPGSWIVDQHVNTDALADAAFPSYSDGYFIAVSSQYAAVYVTDPSHNRVLVFSCDGQLQKVWANTEGVSQHSHFNRPNGVATCEDNVFVVNAGSHTVQMRNMSGTFVCSWGSKGDGPGEFATPGAIAVASDGDIFVADAANGRVQVFKPHGVFYELWFRVKEPGGVALSMDEQQVLITETSRDEAHCVYMFHRDGSLLQKFGQCNICSAPSSIAVSACGELFCGDQAGQCILVFDSNGLYRRTISCPLLYVDGSVQYNSFFGLALLPNGNVLLALEQQHRIAHFH
jgi:DNA-binding beta-propeller fold protein YncE